MKAAGAFKLKNKFIAAALPVLWGIYFTAGPWWFETLDFSEGWLWKTAVLWVLMAVQGFALLRGLGLTDHEQSFNPGFTGLIMLAGGAVQVLFAAWANAIPINLQLVILAGGHYLLLCILPALCLLLYVPEVVFGENKAKATPNPQEIKPEPVVPDSAGPPVSPPSARFVLAATSEDSGLDVPAADLVMVEAADNYCKFYFRENGRKKTRTLRTTLKLVEEALTGAEGFFRCHRSWLVNGQHVAELKGHSQAWKLKMEDFDTLVPVSRSFDISVFKNLPSSEEE